MRDGQRVDWEKIQVLFMETLTGDVIEYRILEPSLAACRFEDESASRVG